MVVTVVPWYLNLNLWIMTSFFLASMTIVLFIILIMMARFTHMVPEFKAKLKGRPIGLFFQDNRFCEWKPIIPDAGVIQDKEYGCFIINERGTYVDKRTKAILIPFDTSIATSVNVKAAKLADDLQYMIKDEEQMKKLRYLIANNLIDDSESINVLKTNIHFGAIKNMMSAVIPHNINSKIEKTIAARLKSYGQVNVPQIALLFASVLGAILIGVIIIKMMFPGAK